MSLAHFSFCHKKFLQSMFMFKVYLPLLAKKTEYFSFYFFYRNIVAEVRETYRRQQLTHRTNLGTQAKLVISFSRINLR